MGPLRLLLLAATGGVGLAACVPVSSVVCNGFPTGNPAAVNSSATQFRLDETESLQAARSPREGYHFWSWAVLYGHVGRLDRSSSVLPDIVELHVVNDSPAAANWSNWSTTVNLCSAVVTLRLHNVRSGLPPLHSSGYCPALRALSLHSICYASPLACN